MAERSAIPLSAHRVDLLSNEFNLIVNWPFADLYVHRLLKQDISQRVRFGNCRIWMFKDPDGQPVGTGTLDICDEYKQFSARPLHLYIPLLAVNPIIRSLGYGTSIMNFLTSEAALIKRDVELHNSSLGSLDKRNSSGTPLLYDVLFLDVYASNLKAIALYEKIGFTRVTEDLFDDPIENMKYYVMSGHLPIAPVQAR
jgi:ribosomal protein S18 acetylase RimI-like enzyme